MFYGVTNTTEGGLKAISSGVLRRYLEHTYFAVGCGIYPVITAFEAEGRRPRTKRSNVNVALLAEVAHVANGGVIEV